MCAFHRRHAPRAWTRLTTARLLKVQVAVRRDRVKDFYLLGQKKKVDRLRSRAALSIVRRTEDHFDEKYLTVVRYHI